MKPTLICNAPLLTFAATGLPFTVTGLLLSTRIVATVCRVPGLLAIQVPVKGDLAAAGAVLAFQLLQRLADAAAPAAHESRA